MWEQCLIVFQVGLSEVEEHNCSVETVAVSVDGSIVLEILLQFVEVCSQFLIWVLLDEVVEFFDGGDVVVFRFVVEQLLE